MTGWKRITLVIFVLIGSTAFFGYWSLNQFDNAFDNLSASYLANTLTVSSSLIKDADSASTSPEMSIVLATSTDETIPVITSTTTTATTTPVTTPSTDLKLSFTFPKKGDEVYIGCTYRISWQSSTIVDSLGIALIDTGTGEIAGPIASGLARENKINTDLQNLSWKVGIVWPGTYYIKVSKINGVEAEFRSKVFEINKMPEGIDKEEKINICRESSS